MEDEKEKLQARLEARIKAEEMYDLIYEPGLDNKEYGIYCVSGWEWLARAYLMANTDLYLGNFKGERRNELIAEIELIEEKHPELRKPSRDEMEDFQNVWEAAARFSSRYHQISNDIRDLLKSDDLGKYGFALAWKLWKIDPRKKIKN